MYIDDNGHLRFEPVPRWTDSIHKVDWTEERTEKMVINDTEYVIRNGDRFGLGKIKRITEVTGCVPVLDLEIKDISHLPSTSPFSISEELNVVVNNDVDNIIVTVVNNFLKDECNYTIPKKRLIAAVSKAAVRYPLTIGGKKQCARCFSDLDINGNFCPKCGQRFIQLKEEDYVY